ncbi:MAG TPA: aldo/keto reductase [Candidatus Hydrogenedentes bacterium]|nr:aldo/keto reductase [Candidatus Hydrogenedentota bacterium]
MSVFLKNTVAPSMIVMGTVSFGSTISKADTFALLDVFAETGGNFIDTAHVYSAWEPEGEGASERTIGEWLRVHGARGSVVLATKGGHPPLHRMDRPRCTYEEMNQDLNESLERLGVDCVDLYWAHRDDPRMSAGEIIDTMARFVQDGRARNIGASNWTKERIIEANAWAAAQGLPTFVANQPRWALADRVGEMPPPDNTLDADVATQKWHEDTGMAMTPFTSQAKGFFGEKNVAWARNGFQGPIPRGDRYDAPVNHQRLLRAIRMAEQKGCTAHQIALAYLMNQRFPVHPIIGTRNPDRIREAMAASGIRLSEMECDWLRGGDTYSFSEKTWAQKR